MKSGAWSAPRAACRIARLCDGGGVCVGRYVPRGHKDLGESGRNRNGRVAGGRPVPEARGRAGESQAGRAPGGRPSSLLGPGPGFQVESHHASANVVGSAERPALYGAHVVLRARSHVRAIRPPGRDADTGRGNEPEPPRPCSVGGRCAAPGRRFGPRSRHAHNKGEQDHAQPQALLRHPSRPRLRRPRRDHRRGGRDAYDAHRSGPPLARAERLTAPPARHAGGSPSPARNVA